jgi:hypothetical protein
MGQPQSGMKLLTVTVAEDANLPVVTKSHPVSEHFQHPGQWAERSSLQGIYGSPAWVMFSIIYGVTFSPMPRCLVGIQAYA